MSVSVKKRSQIGTGSTSAYYNRLRGGNGWLMDAKIEDWLRVEKQFIPTFNHSHKGLTLSGMCFVFVFLIVSISHNSPTSHVVRCRLIWNPTVCTPRAPVHGYEPNHRSYFGDPFSGYPTCRALRGSQSLQEKLCEVCRHVLRTVYQGSVVKGLSEGP